MRDTYYASCWIILNPSLPNIGFGLGGAGYLAEAARCQHALRPKLRLELCRRFDLTTFAFAPALSSSRAQSRCCRMQRLVSARRYRRCRPHQRRPQGRSSSLRAATTCPGRPRVATYSSPKCRVEQHVSSYLATCLSLEAVAAALLPPSSRRSAACCERPKRGAGSGYAGAESPALRQKPCCRIGCTTHGTRGLD